jgi:hypothetical protein
MVNSAERHRLEAAHPAPADPRSALRACSIGLLVVLIIAIGGGFIDGPLSDRVARVSAPPAATGR